MEKQQKREKIWQMGLRQKQSIRLEVSEDDAMRLANRREAKLEYYENTGRLIAIK